MPNGRFYEAILNSSFRFGAEFGPPYRIATENDKLNGISHAICYLLTKPGATLFSAV